MPSTVQYLDAVRAKHHIGSDAELARTLGVQRQTICRYRLMPVSMDDEIAMRVAKLLDIRPATILLDMYAERQRNPAIKAVWQEAADELRTHA
jgi:predicted transcriptional regulator